MTEMKTFREAYAVLQKHAQTLRSQQEPDIDNLTTIVSESLAAHKICKERIDAVEKALEESLGAAQVESDSGSVAQRSPRSKSSGDPAGDDEIRF
jgi:exodeoxyribonuclease VII small subunit